MTQNTNRSGLIDLLLIGGGLLTAMYFISSASGLKTGNWFGDWLGTLIPKSDPVYVPPKETWCESLGHMISPGLTCPVFKPVDPIPVDPVCPLNFVYNRSQGGCDLIPGFEPVIDPPYTPGLVDRCTFPDGSPLTVPVGMNCNQAISDMCIRFKSIPGWHGCP
jgi:hypothetical protein